LAFRAPRIRLRDLGCGEGKNAAAFAQAGALVVAVDCSVFALTNGQREFGHAKIEWVLSDAETYLRKSDSFDVIVMYGLLHCLASRVAIASVLKLAISRTGIGGHHIVAAFNDGPHDLSAHPGFVPTLAPHNFYLKEYRGHRIVSESNELLHETHPHNNIPHFHSLTRLIATRSK
jgi:2-polyprenyl-3-methyl-5-hydroxy-6-metoxy-1,4-benzoquinol methylase